MVPGQKETIQTPQCIPLSHPMILYAIITATMRKAAAAAVV
jgi:hypothetical protein